MSATVFFADPASEIASLVNVFAVNGVPTDPTAVTLTITDPAGATSAPTASKTGTGTYTAQVPCTLDGIWVYEWTGTGAAADVQKGTWTVGPSDLSRLYCTTEELKSRLKLASTADDFEAAWAVATACRGVDAWCERYFWRGTDTRTYVPDVPRVPYFPYGRYLVRTDDIVSVTALTVDRDGDGTFEETWTQGTDYQLQPVNPNRAGEPRPYTKIRAIGALTFPWPLSLLLQRADRVQVAGVFGWPSVPAFVKMASLITAAELFRAKDLPLGGEVPGEFTAVTTIASNPVIAGMLGPYRRNPFPVA